MPPLNVIEPSIVAFGDHWRQGIVGNADLRIAGDHPVHDPVGHSRHVQRICEGNRILQKSRFGDPGKAGHLASPIEDERPGRHFLVPHIVARDDDRHAGSYRAEPGFERPVAGDEGGLAHSDAGHVGNRVERSRGIGADDDAKSTRSQSRTLPAHRLGQNKVGATQIPMARISSGIVGRALPLDLMARSDMGDSDLNLGSVPPEWQRPAKAPAFLHHGREKS